MEIVIFVWGYPIYNIGVSKNLEYSEKEVKDMAVGGISSSYMNSYMNYSSTINQLRLQQALQRNQINHQKVQPVPRVSSYNGSRGTYSASGMSFLKDYNSSMSDLMQSANTLRGSNSSGAANALVMGSTDESVLTAEGRYSAAAVKDLTVDVKQVAKAQMNQSESLSASSRVTSGMDFTIQSQKASGGVSSINVSVDAKNEKGITRTNKEMLTEAARQINQAKGDVQASVVDKDGKVALQLTGKNTGAGNTFSLSGSTGEFKGLSETSQAAQDARYSVTRYGYTQDYTSSDNKVSLDYGRVSATLKGEGKAAISPQADSDKIIFAVEDLVKSYNNAIELLGRNTDKGPGVTNQLRNLVRGIGSTQSLEKAGITRNDDGTLSLDKEVLAKNLKKEPGLVNDIISGQNGLAQTAYNKAGSGLQTNSASLLQYDLNQKTSSLMMTDNYHFLNSFSRAGAHNLSNYMALGLMMDYLV